MPDVSADRVAVAWMLGRRADGASLWTRGATAYSWRHPIGLSDPREDGTCAKVVRCCHASQSTAQHSSILLPYADALVECPEHGRPDLHQAEPTYQARRLAWVGRLRFTLRDCPGPALTVRGPATAFARFPHAVCAYRCLACDRWHVNSREDRAVTELTDAHTGARRYADQPNHVWSPAWRRRRLALIAAAVTAAPAPPLTEPPTLQGAL